MTGSALCVAVISEQREPGKRVVKEHVFGPRMLVVAVFADRSLGALVRVVVHMTQTAGCRWLSVEYRLDVTGCAWSVDMGAAEDVVRIDVVIENQLRPLRGNVARVTTFAKMTLMIVIVPMAGIAGCA